MATSALLRLLALASIVFLSTLICGGCQDPDGVDPNPVDDDDPIADDDDSLPTECTVEASTYIEDALISADKPDDSHTFDDCLAEVLDEEDRSEEDAEFGCSMVAPANVALVLNAFAPNAVSCPVPLTLAAATTPHEEVIPLGYGSETPHGYDSIAPNGANLGTVQVETTCQDGMVKVNTHGAGMYEVVGDQLWFRNPNTDELVFSGSITHDLELYEFSSGGRLERRP